MATQPAHNPVFDGFASPNYTPVPDELFDVLLPTLADNELRVLLYIIRRTFGFKRETDSISLSQMVHGITTKDGSVLDSGTGLSKSTVARGLKSLREKSIIVATRNASTQRGDEPTTYRLHVKTDATPEVNPAKPVSRHQDTPRVASTRRAVLQPWDTQQTGQQDTAFEYSNEETLGWDQEPERGGVEQTGSNPLQTGASLSEGSLGQILKHRIRRDVGRNERQQISAAIAQIAAELGDRAEEKSSVSRALNLFQAADVHVAGFVDLLYRVRGEVRDRYRNPGKAPIPRKRMAYFFAVVEDRLGLKERAA